VTNVKNFVQKIPEIYLNLFEKKVIDRILCLITDLYSYDEIDEFIKVIKFLDDCEILTIYTINCLKIKLEHQKKLTPKMYSYFLKINTSNPKYNI